MSSPLQKFRIALVSHGGFFYVLVVGVLFFGGGTFAMDVCIKIFANHQKLDGMTIFGIAMEKIVTGIFFGSTIWFLQPRPAKTDKSIKHDTSE